VLRLEGRLKNGDLLRQQKKPDRLCMRNTLRVLFFLLPCISPFLNGLRILDFLTVS
jgi:hypothetical protein